MYNHHTKDSRDFIIRKPVEDDAQNLIEYSKILFRSTDQVLTTLEEYTITTEGEKNWIKSFNENPNALVLIALLDQQIVGLLFFMSNTKIKTAHSGEFGVSVHPDYQNIGIGRTLIERLLGWAKTNQQIEKVSLQVFATNTNAIKLYEELGFTEEGRHVKSIKQKSGEYVDVIQMYLNTK